MYSGINSFPPNNIDDIVCILNNIEINPETKIAEILSTYTYDQFNNNTLQ